ncbi:Heme/hemopexin utilization protein C precursor [Anatilimnocola aggregata]|uniref:Heme/hemopexin utilization protein C n=1 Tax=Anatilimnocola aggregata TaxID=2528021 RepID=A0A517YNI2_9BACT|nr:TonB-dependent receptor [Anatilimnocola aggregata]QDU31785.1 Heme/hemopexin utilization protein C precursor [Anatilimnocola aggregata]
MFYPPRWIAALLAMAAFPALVGAQETTSTSTLQPVTGQPQTLPDTDVVGQPTPSATPFDPGNQDLPAGNFAFPALTEQFYGGASPLDFGGLNNVIKGEKSLFEQSNFGTIIDQETIREKQATDMFRALQFEPGVLMQQTGRGQASPFIRGVTGQQLLILVDGIRVNNSVLRAGPNQYFNTFDPGQVERIEVLRSSGSVLYGSDAIGGTINIVTRSADPTRANYTAGSFRQFFSTADNSPYSRANIEGWVGGGGLFAGASFMDVNDIDIGGGRGRQPFTNYEQYAGDIKYNLMVNDDQVVTVALSHFEQSNLPRSDRFPPFVFNRPGNTARPTFFDPQQRDLAYIRWQGMAYNINPLFDTFTTTFSYQRTKEGSREFTNFSVPLNDYTRRQEGEFDDEMLGFQASLSKDLTAEGFGIITYGTDYYYEDIDASRQRFSVQTGAPLPPNQQAIGPQYPDDSIADRVGCYLNWDVLLTSRLNAVIGVRYENSDQQGTPRFSFAGVPEDVFYSRTYQDWIGSIGLTYNLTDEINIVGGVYEGYRAPTVDDLVVNTTFAQNAVQSPQLAALNVQPEHSVTYEIGAKYSGERLQLQIFEWWNSINDYLARDTVMGNTVLANHDAFLNGTELAGEYLLDPTWSLFGNFAYTFGQDLTIQDPINRIPPTQGVLGLRWRELDRRSYFEVFAWMVNRQDRNSNNPNTVGDSRFYVNGQFATPGFATLNLRTGTTWGEFDQHRVSLSLENITDQYYRVHGSGVDGTGFNAIFGYEYRQ